MALELSDLLLIQKATGGSLRKSTITALAGLIAGGSVFTDVDATSLQDAVTAASGRTLYMTRDWTLTGSISIPDNTRIEGAGGAITMSAAVTARAFNCNGDNISVSNIRFNGNAAGSGAALSSEGIAVYAAGRENISVTECFFTNWRGHVCYFPNCTEVRGENNIFYRNIGDGTHSTVEPELYAPGGTADTARISFNGNFHFAHPTQSLKKDLGMFVAAFTTAGDEAFEYWMCDNYFDGYRRGGIGNSDEENTQFGGRYHVNRNIIINSGQSAIKLKNQSDYDCSFNVINNFEIIDIELFGSNLKGGVFLNAGGNGVAIGNVIRHDKSTYPNATSGINMTGNPNAQFNYSSNPRARSGFIVSDTVSTGIPDWAIEVQQNVYDLTISNCVTRGSNGWIRLNGSTTTPDSYVQNVMINGGSFRGQDNTGNTVTALQITNVAKVQINGGIIQGAGGYGALISIASDVTMIGTQIFDAGKGGGSTRHGLRVGSTANLKLIGVTSVNRDNSNQQYGISLGGGNSNFILVGCEFSGTVAPTTGTLPDTTKIEGCVGVQSIEVTITVNNATTITVNSYATHYALDGPATNNITAINGGDEGQIIHLRRGNSDVTFTKSSSLNFSRAANGTSVTLANPFTAGSGFSNVSFRKRGAAWQELSRSGP